MTEESLGSAAGGQAEKRAVTLFRGLLREFDTRTIMENKKSLGLLETHARVGKAFTRLMLECSPELGWMLPDADSRSKSEASHDAPIRRMAPMHDVPSGLGPGVTSVMAALFDRLTLVKPSSKCAQLLAAAREADEWKERS